VTGKASSRQTMKEEASMALSVEALEGFAARSSERAECQMSRFSVVKTPTAGAFSALS